MKNPESIVNTTAMKKRYLLALSFIFVMGFPLGIMGVIREGLSFVGIVLVIMLVLCPTFSLIYLWFFDVYSIKFFMSKDGVANKKHKQVYYLRWEEIEHVQVLRNFRKRKASIIAFSRTPIIGAFSEKFQEQFKSNNPTFIGVQYRKGIVKEIQKHWDKPIRGLYQGKP